jgi:nucleoside-diphosphate-sugar epimerase
MARRMKHILFFGYGFSAQALANRLDPKAWRISATSRSEQGLKEIAEANIEPLRFHTLKALPETVTHIVTSAPPGDSGDPVLRALAPALAGQASQIEWAAYLSTTGVYGDHAGAWVDEQTPLTPSTSRGFKRLEAETAWLALWEHHGLPVHLFRLAGIYGPGRNQLETMLDGTARRVIKKGQVFSRIHVDDIAGILLASMAKPNPGAAYNCADDEPCPPQEVVTFAASLLGMPPPPEEDFDAATLSPMAKSFYAESKRVSNARIKSELSYSLLYPTYRAGLTALFKTPQLKKPELKKPELKKPDRPPAAPG